MKHFNNITSYEELKAQYRTLALTYHPDAGGDTETMKAINNEYDQLFPLWKHRSRIESAETASSTRSEFYTANGWKGDRYNRNISTKEVAAIIREYVKDVHNDYRFSVRYESYTGGSSFSVTMTEAPAEVFTNGGSDAQLNQYALDRDERITKAAREVMQDINKVITSYRMDDSDGQIDYFHTNFYYSLNIGAWDKPLKIVPRQKKTATGVEYETVEVTKTRTYKTLEPREIPAPAEFQPGQMFRLKSSFNYGCYRGAVYQIDRIIGNLGGIIYAYKMGKGYKNVCKGDVRGNSFSCTDEKLRQWIDKGAIIFVELVEVTKTEEYTSSVRRPKKQTGISTEVREPSDSTTYSAAEPKAYTVTEDTDTRDGSALWVVKFAERMSREEYQATAATLKEIGGNYSKFKHGFIFRADPAADLAKLYGEQEPGTPGTGQHTREEPQQPTAEEQAAARAAEKEAKLTAQQIEDESTAIISALRLKPGEYTISSKYKTQLAEYIQSIRDRITPAVIEKIAYPELRAIVRIIFENEEIGAA